MLIVAVAGGLGNQMFQYAFYRKMKHLKKNIKIDALALWNEKSVAHNGYELNRIFRLNVDFANAIERAGFLGRKDLLSKVRQKFSPLKNKYSCQSDEEAISFIAENFSFENKYLLSYWQSERYFEDISDEIRKDFSFPAFTGSENMALSDKIRSTNSVSIHIRRGDYVQLANVKDICSLAYYKNAIRHIKETVKDPVFYVFSNDIAWCEQNLAMEEAVFIDHNKGEDSYKDMQLMSYCKHNIIANSSFSWWGAWLNNNPEKIVLAPDKWFENTAGTKDIIPDSWIKISRK